MRKQTIGLEVLMKHQLLLIVLVGFMCAACDNGMVTEPEERGDELSMSSEHWDTKCAALAFASDEPLTVNPLYAEPLQIPRLNVSIVHWMANLPDESEEDDRPDFCDCTGMCNACMDAYICGHEAAILEYCDECAQCQKECNPETDE